jgi:serine/threonine-protein kinase
MGSVYLCRVTGQAGFRRLFALKVLRARLRDDAESTDLFLQEARIAARVHHPNVVAVLDASVQGTQPYLVMDYVEGCSLHTLLDQNPAYRPPELILPIILDALNGLHAIHSLTASDGSPLGLVHCDVSPDNLLVGVDGASRISDFGVTRMRSAGLSRFSSRGKAAYLAPERVAGRQVDQRADVFSMGVVLYNALTGTRLFRTESIEGTLHNVQHADILPPSRVGLRPPDWLDAVCLRALARNPHARYSSADEMMFELKRVMAHYEVVTLVADIAMWVRRTVGPELQVRRLATLDGSRRSKRGVAVAPRQEPAVGRAKRPSEPPPPAVTPSLTGLKPPRPGEPRRSAFPQRIPAMRGASGQVGASPEDPVPASRAKVRTVLIAASVVAAAAVLICVLWPTKVGRLFSIDRGTMPISADYPLQPGAAALIETDPASRASPRPSGSPPALSSARPEVNSHLPSEQPSNSIR